MSCLCSPKITTKIFIIWFHCTIWMMVNKLDMFFSNQTMNITRPISTMLWLNEVVCIAIEPTIVFQLGRDHMICGILQLAKNPLWKTSCWFERCSTSNKSWTTNEKFLSSLSFTLLPQTKFYLLTKKKLHKLNASLANGGNPRSRRKRFFTK